MSTELEQIDDHVEDAETLLLEQFRNATNLKQFLGAFTEQIQTIEDMLIDLWQSRWIDNAVGEQLDGIGDIVGQERNGQTDEAYRVRILLRINLNVSRGTGDDIMNALALLTDESIGLHEYSPAAFTVIVLNITEEAAEEIADAVQDAKAAGVYADVTYSTVPSSETFTWNGTVAQGWNAGEWAHTV